MSNPFVARASWTLFDQGVVSGGNFLLNLLLARALPESDYGEFALFLGTIFVLRAVDYSFISYPLAVRLCTATPEEKPALRGNTLVLAVILGMALLLVVATGIMLLSSDHLMVPACLCFVCWQAQETSRRFLFAEFRYRESVVGDGVGYIGPVVILAFAHQAGPLSIQSALYAMSASFALGAVAHTVRLDLAPPQRSVLRWLGKSYIAVGMWSLVSYQLNLLRFLSLPWLLAAFSGTAATASLQAGYNLANVVNPITIGIGNAVPQVAAHAYGSGNLASAVRAAGAYIAFGLGPTLVICAAGLVMPELLLKAAYGSSSPYVAVAFGLQLLVVGGALNYVAELINKTLLGIGAGRLAFLVNVSGAATALICGVLLVGRLGMVGACYTLVAANSVQLVVALLALAWLFFRAAPKDGFESSNEASADAMALSDPSTSRHAS